MIDSASPPRLLRYYGWAYIAFGGAFLLLALVSPLAGLARFRAQQDLPAIAGLALLIALGAGMRAGKRWAVLLLAANLVAVFLSVLGSYVVGQPQLGPLLVALLFVVPPLLAAARRWSTLT